MKAWIVIPAKPSFQTPFIDDVNLFIRGNGETCHTAEAITFHGDNLATQPCPLFVFSNSMFSCYAVFRARPGVTPGWGVGRAAFPVPQRAPPATPRAPPPGRPPPPPAPVVRSPRPPPLPRGAAVGGLGDAHTGFCLQGFSAEFVAGFILQPARRGMGSVAWKTMWWQTSSTPQTAPSPEHTNPWKRRQGRKPKNKTPHNGTLLRGLESILGPKMLPIIFSSRFVPVLSIDIS